MGGCPQGCPALQLASVSASAAAVLTFVGLIVPGCRSSAVWVLGGEEESCCSACGSIGMDCSQSALRSIRSCAAIEGLEPYAELNATTPVEVCDNGNSRIHPSMDPNYDPRGVRVAHNDVEDISQAVCNYGAANHTGQPTNRALTGYRRFCPCVDTGGASEQHDDGGRCWLTVPTDSLAACFTEDEAGGGVLKQTIGKTAAMARDEADPTQQAMETCGWRFADETRLRFFCPGSPRAHRNISDLQPTDDYSVDCTVAQGTEGRNPDPMIMVYHAGRPQGIVNYTLPSSGFCRFRIKVYEHSRFLSIDPATLELASRTVWTSGGSNATCATVVAGVFEPGDVITLTEHSLLALFWFELIPEGSPQCEMVPAEVTATECCGDCAIPAAPTDLLAACFTEDEAGGGVLKQTIGKTAAMARDEDDPTQQAMETCGWRFALRTRLYFFCPGHPYDHERPWLTVHAHTWLRDDYTENCSVADERDAVPEPMVMVFNSGHRQGSVTYQLPSTPVFCRFRIKFYERYSAPGRDYDDGLGDAMVHIGDRLAWTQNESHSAFYNASSCATVVSGAFQPGDVITLTERSILALFWLELVPEGSPHCAMMPAEVTATECCGDCVIRAALTARPTSTSTAANPGSSSSAGIVVSTTTAVPALAEANEDDVGGGSSAGLVVFFVLLILVLGTFAVVWKRRQHGPDGLVKPKAAQDNPVFSVAAAARAADNPNYDLAEGGSATYEVVDFERGGGADASLYATADDGAGGGARHPNPGGRSADALGAPGGGGGPDIAYHANALYQPAAPALSHGGNVGASGRSFKRSADQSGDSDRCSTCAAKLAFCVCNNADARHRAIAGSKRNSNVQPESYLVILGADLEGVEDDANAPRSLVSMM